MARMACDEALAVGRGDRDLGAELVADPRLALRDAVDFGLVQGVELALVPGLLAEQPVGQGNLARDPLPQGGVRHGLELPLDVAHHPAGIALQPPQALAHPLELAGMGVAAHLAGEPRREAGVRHRSRTHGDTMAHSGAG
jgi:hypothetical protein